MRTSRRDFLKQTASGAALLSTGLSLPRFLARTAQAANPARGERILVVVQLSGGNDGLNTVIPYADDIYHRARPTIRVPAERVLKLSDALGLAPEMRGFQNLFEAGALRVVTNVGYPNPDRSHFRAMDIWHTACLEPEKCGATGWLGRVVDADTARLPAGDGANSAPRPAAMHLGDASLPLALKTLRTPVASVNSIDAFRIPAGAGDALGAIHAARRGASDDLQFVQRIAVASCDTARRIEEASRAAGGASRDYPDYGLARRLEQIAQLIGADFGPRIYYTSLDGFDTHARQNLVHGGLMRELSDSVAAFFRNLKAMGCDRQVALLTFSEFGRRVAENGSQGTDHGAAAPVFLAGPAFGGAITGDAPDLGKLEDGDLRYTTDFRRIYATLLDKWLDVRHEGVLGSSFEMLNLLST